MAPLYRYLAHPSEGILNDAGVSSSHQPKPLGRKPSNIGLVASKNSIPKINLPWDESLYEKLKKENDEELEGFKKEEEEAAEKAGETEVQAARGKRAEFWARVGDKVGISSVFLVFIDLVNRTKLLLHTKRYSRRLVFWELRLTWYLLLSEWVYSTAISNWSKSMSIEQRH